MLQRTLHGLLVEDDPEDTLLLMRLMAGADWPAFKFIFACAESLKEGLSILAEGETELVLLDLMLPDSRGIDTLLKVREQAPDLPIVVLTGLRDEALGLEALSRGAQDFQVKGSTDGHALKRSINYAVERHRLLNSFKNVLANSPDGLLILDAEGLVRYCNRAAQELFQRTEGALLNKPLPYPVLNARTGEMRIPRSEEAERVVEMKLADIDWHDQPAKLASLRDITDLRRLEQLKAEIAERRRIDGFKDELMAEISHEMRTPLTVLAAATSSLQEELAGRLSGPQEEILVLQSKNIARLERIIDKTLDLARLESGKARIALQSVDASALIRETARGFRLTVEKDRVSLEEEIFPDLPHLQADPELLVQALSNLLDNALRFARTRVVIRAEKEGEDQVRISVIDDGRGIPQERMGDLFNKFVQVERSISGQGYKGTGLGLALCKEIIELQGGRIWAESGAGRGTAFHFTLPRHELTYA